MFMNKGSVNSCGKNYMDEIYWQDERVHLEIMVTEIIVLE